ELTMQQVEVALRYNRILNEEYGQLWVNSSRGQVSSKTEFGISHAYRLNADAAVPIAEPSFWVASIQSASTGLHADEACIDDLNKKKNTRTAHQRALVQEFYELIYPLIATGNGHAPRITMSCTPWHDDDVRGRIKRNEQLSREIDEDYKSPWRILH